MSNDDRITALEKLVTKIQLAMNSLATKAELNQAVFIRQNEITKLQQELCYLHHYIFADRYMETSFNAALSVNVVHNYGIYPLVQVCDNTGAVLIPQSIVNNTVNDYTVTFSQSTSGTIITTVGFNNPYTGQ
jgi:uncharacterized coiled-coil protein SlyX